jgi:uncharacterized delta-60 repeat protein
MKKRVVFFPCQKDFWQGLKTFVLALLVVSGCIAQSKAQTWTDDPTFTVTTAQGQAVGVRTSTTPNEIRPLVGKIIALPDGKILVGGSFNSFVSGVSIGRLARLEANGLNDATFNTGGVGFTAGTNFVNDMVRQSDGRVFLGGSLFAYNGFDPVNGVLRINTNGMRDQSFVAHTIAPVVNDNVFVYALALQPDGKVIVGGSFRRDAMPQNQPLTVINRIIRLNSNGTRDDSFATGAGITTGADRTTPAFVYALAIQSDGRVIVGGDFTNYDGVVARKIIRLNSNGSIDDAFRINIGNGFGDNDKVYAIALQGDKIVLGGNFTTFNGAAANHIIRLNNDGTRDTQFNIGNGFNNPVRDIQLQGDKIFVGGDFTAFNNTPFNRLVRLNANGTRDETFSMGTGFDNRVRTIAVQPDGKIIVGGDFMNFNGVVKNGIVRLASLPTITTRGTLTAFSTCAGTPSTTQTYTVSGSNLSANISITAPAGFEISSNGTSFSNTLTLNAMNGTVANTTITVRLAANASGAPSGNITHTSGTVTQNLAVSGTVNPIPTITLGMIESINTRSTSFSIPYTATTGSPNQYSLTAGTNPLPGFTPITNQTLPASPIVVSVPQNSVAGNYNFNLTVRNSSTGCVSAVIPFTLNNVMSAVDDEFSNSILAYPNPTSNKITVQLPKNAKIEAIKLLNPFGQEVASLSKQEIQEQLQLDLSSYASGVYYLHVIEQKRVAVKRINLTK